MLYCRDSTEYCVKRNQICGQRAPEADVCHCATILCTCVFLFKIKAFAYHQCVFTQFYPQKMCRTRMAHPTRYPARTHTASIPTIAVPATKTRTHLNLNRIKYLSQHKQACAHSFPQKVCKESAGAQGATAEVSHGTGADYNAHVDKVPCSILRQQHYPI